MRKYFLFLIWQTVILNPVRSWCVSPWYAGNICVWNWIPNFCSYLSSVVVPRLLFQERHLNTSGIITSWPELKTRWRKGLFLLLAILFKIILWFFSCLFVCETGSTDGGEEWNRQKDGLRLAIFCPERDSGVIADIACGWNKREISLEQVKF